MSDTQVLFRPITIRNTTFKNRLAMAPMTRGFSPDGVPGDNVRDYYARRAAADVGLIISEGTLVHREGAADNSNYPLFWGDKPLQGWKNVIDAVHLNDGKMAPQLWHLGMMRKPGTGHFPDAPTDGPSGITLKGKKIFEEPSISDVEAMAQAYVDAAADAVRLGFDAIEFHGAHGYLIHNFFCDVTNKRTDRFGGTLVDRARFAIDIIKETRKVVGDTPIILRWSQWHQVDYTSRLTSSLDELAPFLEAIAASGVDMLHASQRRYWEPEFPEIDGKDGLNLAGWCKKITGLPSMSVGSVGLGGDFFGAFAGEGAKTRPITDLIERMERDEFDMIAVGRALLQDPNWVTKVKEGRLDELQPYDASAIKTLY
ncbi:NADH:flavin oxidoreductase [Aestuariibacter salexigens]|uniref:NADH:flavin oxidoreductase n=1 Tax=Aestuariibacter salexigens TaxID=226010 RepID=UPI000425AF34|nr:NADH:flavin oxidoreductase [Aestuariibacter salexigens]